MSIKTKLAEIKASRQTIGNKVQKMGLGDGTEKLEVLATKIDGISVKEAESTAFTVTEGTSTSIPAGYYKGGTITGLSNDAAEAEKYRTQTKTVTPTKSQQNVYPDNDNDGTLEDGEYYALSAVTVEPIPANYADVADASYPNPHKLLKGYTYYGKNIDTGEAVRVEGDMPDKGQFFKYLDYNTREVTIPEGYHNGEGKVQIWAPTALEVTPSKETQSYDSAKSGILYGPVTVKPIPDEYQDISGVTATAADVMNTKKFVGSDGVLTDGAMANYNHVTYSVDGINVTTNGNIDEIDSTRRSGYYGAIDVEFDDSAIIALLEEI